MIIEWTVFRISWVYRLYDFFSLRNVIIFCYPPHNCLISIPVLYPHVFCFVPMFTGNPQSMMLDTRLLLTHGKSPMLSDPGISISSLFIRQDHDTAILQLYVAL